MKKTLIFIPTYNERDNVEKMCRELLDLAIGADILFMDDGSPDGTGEVLDELSRTYPQVSVIHRPGKQGIGSAHLEGAAHAYANGYARLITMDCDFTHCPSDIPRMLAVADEADMVIGSRYMNKNSLPGWSPFRKFLTMLGHFLTRNLLGVTQDASGAFRVYDLEKIPKGLFDLVTAKSYSFFFESLFILLNNGVTVREIPIVLPARTYGHSKLTFAEAARSARLLVSLSLENWTTPERFRMARVTPVIDPELAGGQDWEPYWRRKQSAGTLFYEVVAATYRKLFIKPNLERVLWRVFTPGAELLHAGCGSGHVDMGLHDRFKVTAADISPAALELYARGNPGASRIVHADVMRLPFEDGTFDGAYNLGVMEHFTPDEIGAILRELGRVLKPGGRIVLFWPHEKGTSVFVLKDRRVKAGSPQGAVAGEKSLTAAWACAAVTVLGAYFRFADLGVPTLWFDEMFSAIMSSRSLDYITEFALKLGLHPPFFYYYLKLASQAGLSDFALRFTFALAGTATVYLTYRFVRERFSGSAALFAALFIAINPLHIWLSRQIRPYALLILCFLLSVHYLARFLQSGGARGRLGLILSNAALLSLHFLCFPLVASEMAVVFVAALRKRDRSYWKTCAWLYLATALTAAPSLYFLLTLLNQGNGYVSSGAITYADALQNILSCLREVLFLTGPYQAARLIVMAACLAGAIRLAVRRPAALSFLAAIGLVPVALILLLRFGSGIMPAYLSFLLVPISVLAGLAFEADEKRAPFVNAAALAAAVLCFALLRPGYAQRFQAPEAPYASSIYNAGRFKSIAKALPETLGQGDLVIMADQTLAEGINWYLDQFMANSPISNQRLSPDDAQAYFDFVGLKGYFSHLADTEEALYARFGQPVSVGMADGAAVTRFKIPRRPVERLSTLPDVVRIAATPTDVFVKAYSLKDLALSPFWEGSLIPSKADSPGRIEFALDNGTGGFNHSLWALFSYSNSGEDDLLEADATFDEEPAGKVFVSKGADGRHAAVVKIERDKPYKSLRLGFSLTARRNTPSPNLADLERLGLKKVSFYVCDRQNEEQCLTRLYMDALPQKLLDESSATQKITAKANVRDDTTDQEGWSAFKPADATEYGRVLLELSSDRKDFIYYPRTCGDDSIVNVYEISGENRSLLFSLRGVKDECTPIGLQVLFHTLDDRKEGPRAIEIEMGGKSAQLWHKGESVLY